MANKKLAARVDVPTRRTVESFLRTFMYDRVPQLASNRREQEAYQDVLERERELLSTDKKLRALKRRYSQLHRRNDERKRKILDKVRAVRGMYQVSGLTPKVVRALKQLQAMSSK
jgi:replicative DNA helicase